VDSARGAWARARDFLRGSASGRRTLGIITPFGGLSFIAAWLALAWMLLRNQS
jgi:uncharacterized membrane protein YgdD (TMEM256/DUF423 family)